MNAMVTLGVPYTDEMVAKAKSDLVTQLDEFADDEEGFRERYPNAAMRDFDGDTSTVTEMDALVAYLQMLGTLVDFTEFEAERDENLR